MHVIVNEIKHPVIHALFQNMENNMEKFMGSNDAIEISQNVGVSKDNAYDTFVLILFSKQTAPVGIYKSQNV